MNLLRKYIPECSGYIESIEYHEKEGSLEVVFLNQPEKFSPILKLVFSEVSEFKEELHDIEEENFIELVIGLDLWRGQYCLHTDVREINFKASKVAAVPIRENQ